MVTPPITQADVQAFAPQLSALSVGAWADILAYVMTVDLTTPTLGEDNETARMAQILLAAHLGQLTKIANSAAAGPLTGESAGGIRRSYAMLSTNGTALSSTRYGQMYLDVILMSAAHGPFVA